MASSTVLVLGALTFRLFNLLKDGTDRCSVCLASSVSFAVRLRSSMRNLLLSSLNLTSSASDSLSAADRRAITIRAC